MNELGFLSLKNLKSILISIIQKINAKKMNTINLPPDILVILVCTRISRIIVKHIYASCVWNNMSSYMFIYYGYETLNFVLNMFLVVEFNDFDAKFVLAVHVQQSTNV